MKVSPIDGRYFNHTAPLQEYFSEYAFIKFRVRVECEYLIALTSVLPELQGVSLEQIAACRSAFFSRTSLF